MWKAEFGLRVDAWSKLTRERGRRYASATLDGFDTPTDDHQVALRYATDYAKTMHTMVTEGRPLVLFGPSGTGKDLLMMGLARIAVLDWGYNVRWRNCQDLFGEMRDAMTRGETEVSVIRSLARVPILALSDLVPPSGTLSEYNRTTLYRIFDARYSDMRPTWVTINATGREQMNSHLGVATMDRLRHNAIPIYCNWESHRTC